MAVHIGDTRMWQAQEDISESASDIRVHSVYGTDSDETLLTGLESVESLEYTGRATGNRLSNQHKYDNDPVTALAEWVVELETYVNGQQGSGWRLKDDDRGKEFKTVVEMVGWQRNSSEKYQVDWDLSGKWVLGEMEPTETQPASVNPSQTWKLDGNDLGSLDSYRQQKRQEMEVYPIAFVDPGENESLPNSGAIRQIMIRGTKVGNRDTFDQNMQDLLGQDNIVQFEEAFPGRTLDVMVESFESHREAGITRKEEYMLELVEGYA